MNKNAPGPSQGPLPAHLAAMASSRESWHLLRAYIEQEYPKAIPERRPEVAAVNYSARHLEGLFRRLAQKRSPRPVVLPIIRPAE
ncbi:hypothetical protein LWF15_18765 [Kineosporia rhizophila]|uniref:hypothetical protein n=1 Tax=Kineosporia TaxID=49184 RepID=UPI000A7E3913|nr:MULTISPECIES: hypothetical protein [Kineosporia]MCE0537534.1 hypothetical protein [Kineosporia rhizophila]GLY18963.1 hypothetical protein Kisp01_59770 [Kineosporia sp. NBRC 101677]